MEPFADFDSFARLSGLCLFNGLSNLSLIVNGLIKNGKPEDTPAAVIENGTLPEQRIVRGTLKDIESIAKQAEIKSPAIIVAGDVAALDFSSTLNLPLKGCRIGITGTESFTGRLYQELAEHVRNDRQCIDLSITPIVRGSHEGSISKAKNLPWLYLPAPMQ